MKASSAFGVNPYAISILSAVAWTTIYFVSKLCLPHLLSVWPKWEKKKRYQACGLVPSTMFILVIVPLSLWVLAFGERIKHVSQGSTDWSMMTISIAFGYFIYDTLIIFKHLEVDGFALLAHGVLCMITYGLAVIFEVYQGYGPVFLLFEASTLFVNIRWFLVELGLKNSKLYVLNGLMLLAVFGTVRILYGVLASVSFWHDTLAEMAAMPAPIYIFYMVSNVCLNGLNFFWFFKIIRGVMKAVKTGQE